MRPRDKERSGDGGADAGRREEAAMCVVGLKFKREGKRWFDDQSH